MKLTITIVSYHSHIPTLKRALQSMVRAIEQAQSQWPHLAVDFFLVDNDPQCSGSKSLAGELAQLPSNKIKAQVIEAGKNLGYGAGHNRCLAKLDSDYHLILNPDVILADDFFLQGLSFLEKETDVVAVAPFVSDENNKPAYLCKRYPSVFDLWLRGFVPSFMQQVFVRRLNRYQMKDVYDAQKIEKDIPIISGCCMLLRTNVFRELKGFDERFFLYFEDFDLSLGLAERGKVAYHPDMHIQHLGGFSAKKGLWHIQQFARSGIQFFDKHGWKWY